MKREPRLPLGSAPAAIVQATDPFAACVPAAANAIACENSKTGNPSSEWDVSGAGSSSIQGFATNISVNKGETVRFKVDTISPNYRLDIYRLGYYGGQGARKIVTVEPSAALPQNQPDCLSVSSTGLVDCGNWAESASWAVPSNATSGIYIARLVREDGTTGTSHIVFIVRDDNGGSDLLFQTSDTTWQAYNEYGGNSLYAGSPAGRAYKVSYNRPFITRQGETSHDWVFDGEYPMVRWLESNGYNVSYSTGVDSDRRGAEILEHKVFLSVGHDEYWSGDQRTRVEAARNAGVHLAYFSGNTMFWKTRWENSIDGSATAYRTLVCYKDTHANAKIDPLPGVWTGTWRDPRFSPPADGGRPENALNGTMFSVNGPAFDAVRVSDSLGKFRFWRGTTVSTQTPGQTATVGQGTVGYEWDEDYSNASRPMGLIRLSTNTVTVPSYLQDYGSNYASGSATHSLTMYRHLSGSLVFSAASIRWSWGLDNRHDQSEAPSIPQPDTRMRQATVNLFADMGVQPATLQSGLIAASQSLDNLAPTSLITAPAAGSIVQTGNAVAITGNAVDNGGGLVAAVNVSVDGGATWKRATGTDTWSYNWTPTANGTANIQVVAIDDNGNVQNPATAITLTVGTAPVTCPCTLWTNATTPAVAADSETAAVEVGVKFQSTVNGWITGLRFYKGATNTGVHLGSLWTSTGALLSSATFSGESASGWQQVNLPAAVAITANTIYVASYHTNVGQYSIDERYFSTTGVSRGPLLAPATTAVGGNGVYKYGAGGFPTDNFNASNYWVDVVFSTTPPAGDTTPPTVSSFTPAAGATGVSVDANVTATFSEALDAATVSASAFELRDSANALIPATVAYDAATRTATLNPTGSLAAGVVYTARIKGGVADPRIKDASGNALAADVTWSFTTGTPPVVQCPCSLWNNSVIPATPASTETRETEVGVKFQSSVSGWVTALRFYKGSGNTGTHTGSLWSSTGTLLSRVAFTSETATGWQQMNLTTPVAITANTIYVASYHALVGRFSYDANYFLNTSYTNGPLRAPVSSEVGGNGVYRFGGIAFPTTSNQRNFWVDVVFSTTPPDTTPPTVASFTPASGATGVSVDANATATFSEPLNATTVNGTTVELRNPANDLVAAAVSYNASTQAITLDPTTSLAPNTVYTARIRGGSADPRIKDLAGNALAADTVWTFTTATTPTTQCPCSLWSNSVIPATPASTDAREIEAGIKFQSAVSGMVTGLRFYKGTGNTGTHTGSLWSSAGALLARVTFTGETATGWQQMNLSAPIAITANTTYIASYHAPVGRIANDSNYFATSGYTNGPLRAPSRAEVSGNGVYRLGAIGFPNNTNSGAYTNNLWVDVVFTPSVQSTDTTPPTISSFTPAANATGVSVDANVTAVFSEGLDAATVNASTVELRNSANTAVTATVSYDNATRTVTLDPASALAAGAVYTARIGGGSTDPRIKDIAGNALAADATWSFTTASGQPGQTIYSLWSNTTTPSILMDPDSSAVELGVKFQSDVSGFITGLRFYKGTGNTGVHVGSLWTSGGALLSSVTFTGESASGWQQMNLPAPVAINANTTYVASYHTNVGRYSLNENYFTTTGVVNAPLRAPASNVVAGNGVYKYGAGGFPTDTYLGSNYWVDVVFATASLPVTDTTPPSVSAVTPGSNAGNVDIGVNVTATFSEPMDPSTINANTVELRNAANAIITSTVTYSVETRTVTLDPSAPLVSGAVYTARIRGGGTDPRAKDAAGNALTADVVWNFTTASAPPTQSSVSLWSNTVTPGTIEASDVSAVEVGVKFQSDVSGFITGLRFYKGTGNTGVHVGSLWTSAGVLLSSVTFTGESASGWQQMTLSAPVAINANTTYVASYHTNVGHYSLDNNYFTTTGTVNGPLRAPASNLVSGNGVYSYGAGGFPTDAFQDSNYWVDVVFSTSGSDTTSPAVSLVSPTPNAANVSPSSNVTATFNEPMDAATINANTVELRDASNVIVPATITYNPTTRMATLDPAANLAAGSVYTAKIRGGTTDPRVEDVAGNALANDVTWSFTTQPNLPAGAGGPILLITSSANNFTQYYKEILYAEGFNSFRALDIGNVNATVIAQYDVAILGEMSLTTAQASMLTAWVEGGGNLIAMRPDKQLSSLLGIVDAASTRADAYLKVNTAQAPGAGIVDQTIQYHSVADLYTVSSATQVATLYSTASQSTVNPAVTLRPVGANGGQAASFTFDLARSIVYTRQGNPSFAGQERDGVSPIRPNDQFFPDYLNLDKVAIPQADEMQRLLANMILYMNTDQTPLPRFWYLPNMKKAAILMTGDDHGTAGGTSSAFERFLAASPQACSIDNWECYRATAWIYTNSGLTNAQANAYRNQGFEIGVHVNTGCADWTPASLESFFATDLGGFAQKYQSIPAQKTNRTHCLAWSDWATHPKVELNHGIRLDANYYYWPGSWIQNRPGFMNGSGMPMKFADQDGSTIDVYQAATHLVNENQVSYPAGINAMIDKALGPEGYYGVFGTHYDFSDNFDQLLLSAAISRNVSLISAQQLLTWLDGRNASTFGAYNWDGATLQFTISVGAGAANLYTLLPTQGAAGQLSSISINGAPVTHSVETIKGRSYAVFRAANGTVTAAYNN